MPNERHTPYTWQSGDVSLKEHFDVRLHAMEQATIRATDALDRRLAEMNEFRAALKEQAEQFITRAEHDALVTDIRSLRESRAQLEGKASQSSVNQATLFAAIGIVLGLVGTAISLIEILSK